MLDLTAIGQNVTPEQWYCGLLIQMGEQLELEDELMSFWQAYRELGPLQRWMEALEQVLMSHYPGLVVIFIDEIDCVRSLPFSTAGRGQQTPTIFSRDAEPSRACHARVCPLQQPRLGPNHVMTLCGDASHGPQGRGMGGVKVSR